MKSKVALLAAATLAGVLAFAAAGASAAGHRAGKAEDTTVRFTVFPAATPSLGVYIADALGFFRKNHINVQYVNVGTGTSSLQMLVANQTDFAISDLTGVTLARATANSDIRFVSGQFSRFMGAIQCRSSLGISGSYPGVMQKLVGKKIGITGPGAATDTYTRLSFLDAGIDPSKASLIPVGGIPNLIAALEAGSVDCVTSYEPMQQILSGKVTTAVDWAAGQGPKILASDYSFNAIAASEGYASSHAGVVRDVASAMRQAIAYGSNPKNAATVAQKVLQFFPGTDVKTLTGVVADMASTLSYKLTRGMIGNAVHVYDTIHPTAKILYPYSSYIAQTMMDVTGPTVHFSKAAKKGKRVTFVWNGVDKPGTNDITDVASGVASYTAQVRVGAGSWKTVVSGPGTTFSLSAGKSVTIRVSARDKAGNTGPWAQASA